MEDPVTVQTVDGRTLAFDQWGPDDGYPVFVLAGTPGGRLVRHVGGEYDRTAVRAVTYDRPGYGASNRLPDRVTRCATIVGIGPFDAPDLDFFAGMDDDEATEWRRTQHEEDLIGPMYQETVAWAETLDGLDDLPANIRGMIRESFSSALAPGPYGMADDYLSLVRPWGFDVTAVACPTFVMIACDDTTVPRGHGEWIAGNIPGAVLVEVDGGHFGPRVEPEERLLRWARVGDIAMT
jgi:pimeloyl-ACP methyl ester carboxylesterase